MSTKKHLFIIAVLILLLSFFSFFIIEKRFQQEAAVALIYQDNQYVLVHDEQTMPISSQFTVQPEGDSTSLYTDDYGCRISFLSIEKKDDPALQLKQLLEPDETISYEKYDVSQPEMHIWQIDMMSDEVGRNIVRYVMFDTDILSMSVYADDPSHQCYHAFDS